MASEDVIELGSSDDDTEPAPKKAKPRPNAMVCIPNIPKKFHDVTIKPAKFKPTFLPKAVTVSKPIVHVNPFANRVKLNGKAQKSPMKRDMIVKPPIQIINRPVKSNITIVKINPNPRNVITTKNVQHPIKISNPISLPPSITVKRTLAPLPVIKGAVTLANVSKQPKISAKPAEVLTVELDDDESAPSTSNPQWYIRPEDEVAATKEDENNKEPEPNNMIEITIEDSPVKSLPNKRTCEVGTELAITIDDSPVKPAAEKRKHNSDSDDEDRVDNTKVPHSKKKLKYPNEVHNEPTTIEIEVESLESYNKNKAEASESAVMDKAFKDVPTSTPKKNASTTQMPEDVEVIMVGDSEFHPVYQRFIDLCFQLENSEDMKKIVEKKIKGYYRQVPKDFTESEEFVDIVTSKIMAMRAGPEKMYLYIKDVVDELNLQRKIAKDQVENKNDKIEEPQQIVYGEDSEFDSRRRRQIRKLEKTIKKLHRAIQKLEEQEVDFDDDDDSVYLLTERYKERMVRVYAKFCQLTNTKMPSEPRIQVDARPGHPAGPAKRLEKWINKKVPIGTPLPFPDFHDVLRCVREANEEDKLGWNEADIMEEARDLFTRCGKKMQRRRQENEWRSAASRLALAVDPAENNNDLKKRLEENRQLATKKEVDIFNKFADRQYQLKLEAEEIGDKEAEESPVESEEEDANEAESVTLENKEKRKERLKRLLHEKSMKEKGAVKDNLPTNETEKPKDSVGTSETGEKAVTVAEPETDTKLEQQNGGAEKVTDKQQNSAEKRPEVAEEAQCISDDSSKVESDIDELHLLQKLHSGDEGQASTLDSSDSETPIAISDTLESSGDNKQKQPSDVISIENSSYSEAEADQEATDNNVNLNKSVEKLIHSNVEIEYVNVAVDKVQSKTNNEEHNESVEDILLASSDDEDNAQNKDDSPKSYVIINDDSLSIDETAVHKQCGKILQLSTTEKVEEYKATDVGSVEETVSFGMENNVNDTAYIKKGISCVDEHKEEEATKNIEENANKMMSEKVNATKALCVISHIESTNASTNEELNIQEDSAVDVTTSIEKDAKKTETEQVNPTKALCVISHIESKNASKDEVLDVNNDSAADVTNTIEEDTNKTVSKKVNTTEAVCHAESTNASQGDVYEVQDNSAVANVDITCDDTESSNKMDVDEGAIVEQALKEMGLELDDSTVMSASH